MTHLTRHKYRPSFLTEWWDQFYVCLPLAFLFIAGWEIFLPMEIFQPRIFTTSAAILAAITLVSTLIRRAL